MPDDPKVWIVCIIAAACIIGVVVWFRGSLKVRKGRHGYTLDVTPSPGEDKIIVARSAELKNVEAGDIAGVKKEGSAGAAGSASSIEVFNDGKIQNARLGDIVGVKQTQNSASGTKKDDGRK